MAQRGRPPRPVEQKKMLGNPGRRPLPDDSVMQVLPAANGVPEPARSLGADGFTLWCRIWDSGIGWVSPDTDIELLLMTCESLDERSELVEQVKESRDPKDRRALRALNSEIVSNLSLLGFTPADRTRLGVAQVKAKTRLEEMMARRDSR